MPEKSRKNIRIYPFAGERGAQEAADSYDRRLAAAACIEVEPGRAGLIFCNLRIPHQGFTLEQFRVYAEQLKAALEKTIIISEELKRNVGLARHDEKQA